MADITRKDLKQDNVAIGVRNSFHYWETHRQRVLQIAGGILALIVLVVLIAWYRTYQHDARQQLLADAIGAQAAPVSAAPSPTGAPTYPTETAKKSAVVNAYTKLMTEHGGSEEAYIAEYSLGAMDLEAGRMPDARKKYQDVADHANANYGSLAKLALAQLDFSEKKTSEAQALLKDLADHPTDLVSKNQATIALARGIAPTQPEEARKLLQPIAGSASDISQVASSALMDLPAK